MPQKIDPQKIQLKQAKAYEKSRQFSYLNETAYNYGLERESWCKVEKSNNEAHTRVNRKHFEHSNCSNIFSNEKRSEDSSRIEGLLQNQIGSHAEKRHYPEKQNSSYFSVCNPKNWK